MPRDRGVGQYLPEEVATHARVRYEAHNALETNDYLFGGTLSGGSLIRDLPSGESTAILLQNQPDSGVYYDVEPKYITNGRCTAQKFTNVDVISTGTDVPIAQQRSDFPTATGKIDVSVGATVDATNAREFPERLASTASGGNAGGATINAESVLVAPGDNLDIVLTNISNGSIDTTVYLKINPIPAELIDTLSDGPSGQ